MATIKTRVYHKNNEGTYDIFHYETSADIVLYTDNNQSTVKGALNTLFTNKSDITHIHGNITKDGKLANAKQTVIVDTSKNITSQDNTVPDPEATGTSSTFIDSIEQNSYSKITVHKANLPTATASVAGITKLGATGGSATYEHVHGNITNGGLLATGNRAVITDANKKITVQDNTVADPTASGTSTEFINAASQSSTGKITVHKANLPTATASVAGITKLGATGGSATYEHVHGNITNDGKVGSTASRSIYTTTGGTVTAGSLAVTDPTTNGNSISFIDTISQSSIGKITATKKEVPVVAANTPGLVPNPGASPGTSKYLREDSTWVVPPNTDTKVTAVANHYAPAADTSAALTANASGATAAWSIDVVKGITLNRDAKGHVTGLSVTSGKIPANPNTDTKVTSVTNHYKPTNTTTVKYPSSKTTGASVIDQITLNIDAAGHIVSATGSTHNITAADVGASTVDAMRFKGTIGTGGTVTTTPTSPATGDAYKVITAGTWGGKAAKVGDMIVCTTGGSSATWELIPSGDEPSGTVTNIATGTGLTGGPITTSGTISHESYTAVSAAAKKVGMNATGHVVLGSALTAADVGAAASSHSHFTATATNGQVVIADTGTTGGIKTSGYTIAKSVPSNAVFTDTDTKVTAVGNHYTPATNADSALTANASGATAAWSIDVVKGITLNRDAKGHVTGLSVTSGKIPANPNTNTTYTIATGDANGQIKVTPSSGSAYNVAVKGLASGAYAAAYTHPTTSGNKHIPSGGSSGQFLGWDSDGTAKWATVSASDVGAAASSHTHTFGTTSVIKTATFTKNTLASLSYTARNVGSASGWSAGTAASASISNGVLTITNGTNPSLTITSVACDDITAWDAGTQASLTTTTANAYTSFTS